MRRQKDRANLFAASGDEDGRRAAQEKINLLTRKYKQFSDAAGLPTQKERLSVAGFHRVKSTSEVIDKALTTGVVSDKIKFSNKTVRAFYKKYVENISELIDRSKPLEIQARLAFELRNKYRTNARKLMGDLETRKKLDAERPNTTFEELIESK